MNLNLTNKTFIISGSSKGIGLKIAEILLVGGANILITGRNKNRLRKEYNRLNSKFGSKVYYLSGNIIVYSTLQKMKKIIKKKWKKLDGIVANAGLVKNKNTYFSSEKDFLWFQKHNFMTSFRFVNYFINEIKKNKGSVVFISSIASIKDLGAPLGYASSKLSLNFYSKFLAKKYAKFSVRVNNVLPGNIIYEGGNWDKKRRKNPKKIENFIKQNVPLERFGNSEEIANIVAFLLSSKSSFITGAEIIVDGGQTIK